MPRFTTAPVGEVAPKRKVTSPSNRALIQVQYQQALREAAENGQAFVVELEDGDKPLTIRNRIKSAAGKLGLDDLTIRRQRNRIVAYKPEGEQLELLKVENR